MKRVRGFGYVGEAEEELDDVELREGFASEHVTPGLDIKAYNCPRCKRKLFEADVSLHGVIFIRCRRCKREVAIETTPTMQRIGFITTIQERRTKNDV